MTSFNVRLPQSPANWSKAWADRTFSTIGALINQAKISSEGDSIGASEKNSWFLS
tara:strand:+ start:1257 stop:1421 length:165 start_codon:yes stop_codon:yes gene_type:complete